MNTRHVGLLSLAVAGSIEMGCAVMAQDGRIKVDPMIGTWELNLGESKIIQGGPTLVKQTEVYRQNEPGGRIEVTITRTFANGPTMVDRFSWPAQGGVVTVPKGSDPQSELLKAIVQGSQVMVETLITPGEWYVTHMAKGSQYATMHKVISPDGRKMRQTVRHEEGEAVLVFDRQ
jgi:hypothetical protein